MQFELSLEYIDHLKSAISEKNEAYIKEQFRELYAVDIALIQKLYDFDVYKPLR